MGAMKTDTTNVSTASGKACVPSAGKPASAGKRFARQHFCLLVLGFLGIAACVIALGVGRYPLAPLDALTILAQSMVGVPSSYDTVAVNTVMNTRLPRVIAAFLIGAALAESGAAYQGIFKNPMVSPDLLGVSEGACVGAALGILMGASSLVIQVFAFVFALIAVGCAVLIPKLFRNGSVLMLVLAGIVVSGFMTSVLGFMKFIADPNGQLADIVFWTMGSLNGIQKERLWVCAPVMIASGAVLFALRWRINAMSLTDAQAHYLGVNVARMRGVVILCATLATASAVCLSGTIGWIGLVVPHMSRLVVGSDNRFVVPASILFGGLFLLVADTLARCLSQMSIPISIITGIVGAPLFVILLFKQRRTVC